MSRLFSTSARRVKKLVWKLNGTTEDVDWAKNMVNEAIDEVPGLAEKVDSGMINGNSHSTGGDPLHVSGVVGRKSLKGDNRVSSFHAYPDGRVKFSDKALGEVKVQDSSTVTESSGSGAAEKSEPSE